MNLNLSLGFALSAKNWIAASQTRNNCSSFLISGSGDSPLLIELPNVPANEMIYAEGASHASVGQDLAHLPQ